MSELKTNKISTNDQNNVAIDNALGLKSYTTAQRDALTSVAGDVIYNTTDATPQFYNGSSWTDLGNTSITVTYLVAAGGGGGGARYTEASAWAGGSGVVIIRYATADATITVGPGLTSSSATDGSDTVVTFTAGTGTISFS